MSLRLASGLGERGPAMSYRQDLSPHLSMKQEHQYPG